VANTSGVILSGAGSAFNGTGAQSIGALFGRTGTTFSTNGTLTVGIGAGLRGRLDTELANLPVTVPAISPAYYLATETTDSVVGFSPVSTLTLLVQQYNLNDTVVIDGVTDANEAFDAGLSGRSHGDAIGVFSIRDEFRGRSSDMRFALVGSNGNPGMESIEPVESMEP
jgi:hypothetical protein